MEKDEFLSELRLHLHGLPVEKIDEVIKDYKDYLNQRLNDEATDNDVIEQIGDPKVIGARIKSEYNKFHESPTNSGQKVIVTIGLIMFNLIFVLGPLLGLVGLVFGLFVGLGSLIISPLLVGIKFIVGNGVLFEFFLSLIFSGIGLLFFPLLIKGTIFGSKLLERYVQWNLRHMRGEV